MTIVACESTKRTHGSRASTARHAEQAPSSQAGSTQNTEASILHRKCDAIMLFFGGPEKRPCPASPPPFTRPRMPRCRAPLPCRIKSAIQFPRRLGTTMGLKFGTAGSTSILMFPRDGGMKRTGSRRKALRDDVPATP